MPLVGEKNLVQEFISSAIIIAPIESSIIEIRICFEIEFIRRDSTTDSFLRFK